MRIDEQNLKTSFFKLGEIDAGDFFLPCNFMLTRINFDPTIGSE
jgi:hypothetical protein